MGKSAILEVKNSEVQIYCHENYTVMTNQPDYKTQIKMMDYWLYQSERIHSLRCVSCLR
ncbi:linear amide C-N hydrolase [Vibrio gazogenes]|uniref:linear amide C-N hydrolase n=1 Tax=Vibrio gazogenes TaxID=687 RepID=UPI001147A4DD